MKSPDDVKKGLECCKPIWKNDHWKTCDRNCPYVAEAVHCRTMLNGDAIAYISQLESKNRCFKEIKESCEKRMIEMAQRMPRWISVEERLPEKRKNVLVFKQRNEHALWPAAMWHIEIDWRGEDGWSKNIANGYFDVTHWMPLPEPQKEE